jgi:hypothetical protein
MCLFSPHTVSFYRFFVISILLLLTATSRSIYYIISQSK